MKKTRYQNNLFAEIQAPNMPADLFLKVMQSIARAERIRAQNRLIFFGGVCLISFASIVPAVRLLAANSTESGFLEFLSLGISDFRAVSGYWRSFAVVLMETVPVLSLTLVLTAVAGCLGSLRAMVRDIKVVMPLPSRIS